MTIDMYNTYVRVFVLQVLTAKNDKVHQEHFGEIAEKRFSNTLNDMNYPIVNTKRNKQLQHQI